MGLLRFAVKSSIAGGLVYYTIDEGLWSKPEKSVLLYGRIYDTVVPLIKENAPKKIGDELSELPSTNDITNLMKKNWNCGVMTSMKFLANSPTHLVNGYRCIAHHIGVNNLFNNVSGSGDGAKKS